MCKVEITKKKKSKTTIEVGKRKCANDKIKHVEESKLNKKQKGK